MVTAVVLRGDAAHLPLPDASVDLVVTSPPYFGLRSYSDGCASCAETARAANRGYMERYCPNCQRVFTSGRNKCHVCDVTTLRTDATKSAPKQPCPDCGGKGQRHYAGQVGSEATPAEYVAALAVCTREWVRVLKPSGSIFVNLGDKYNSSSHSMQGVSSDHHIGQRGKFDRLPILDGTRPKSLLGLPWRYALACMDDLGLILRRDIIWSKPNGLPESVTDRCRSSHEYVFHFTVRPRYYAAVDEIRDEHSGPLKSPGSGNPAAAVGPQSRNGHSQWERTREQRDATVRHPLGKLPGSVWDIPSQPLTVPAHLGVDHFAAFPMELPRRCVLGWSPPGICTACGEGRRPVAAQTDEAYAAERARVRQRRTEQNTDREIALYPGGRTNAGGFTNISNGVVRPAYAITGYACACPEPDAPVRPAVVLDPFGGTGTTALVAAAYGRLGVSVDRSADYCRLARWRTTDPAERAKAMMVAKPPPVPDGQGSLFDDWEAV